MIYVPVLSALKQLYATKWLVIWHLLLIKACDGQDVAEVRNSAQYNLRGCFKLLELSPNPLGHNQKPGPLQFWCRGFFLHSSQRFRAKTSKSEPSNCKLYSLILVELSPALYNLLLICLPQLAQGILQEPRQFLSYPMLLNNLQRGMPTISIKYVLFS